VVAFGPLGNAGDVIRVILIPYDPDDFAAVVLQALSEDFDEKVGDIITSARLSEELGGY
jgi:hypothetical protein